MSEKIKKIKMECKWKYSDKWPYNGMVNDLYRGIQAEENYLVALGLFVYSEAIGWEIRGAKKADQNNWECFKVFTKNYVGYRNIHDLEKIFRDSRNGLAHIYFVKNRFGSIINDGGSKGCGIEANDSNVIIYVRTYFKDFKKGLEKYLDEQNKKN